MLTSPEPGNLTVDNMTSQRTPGQAGDQYDAQGAMYFTVATVCVYGLGIIFFIGSHISKREENKDEEHQIEQYLKSCSSFQYQKERDEVLRLRARWLADSLVGMPGASNYERRISRAQRPTRLTLVREESSGGDSQAPLLSSDVTSPDNSIFPWPHLGRRMRRNACSVSCPPLPDDPEPEPEPRASTTLSPPSPLPGGSRGGTLSQGEGVEKVYGDPSQDSTLWDATGPTQKTRRVGRTGPLLYWASSSSQGHDVDSAPGGDHSAQSRRRTEVESELQDSDEEDEYDGDGCSDSDECLGVDVEEMQGSSNFGVAYPTEISNDPNVPVILVTSGSNSDLSCNYLDANCHTTPNDMGRNELEGVTPGGPSGRAAPRVHFQIENPSSTRGEADCALGGRRRRQGVFHVPHLAHLDIPPGHRPQETAAAPEHEDQSTTSFENPSGDCNGNFQADGDLQGCLGPSPGPTTADPRRLLSPGDLDRASRWSLPDRVTSSRAPSDVSKVHVLGRRVMSSLLLRIPGRVVRGQPSGDPLLPQSSSRPEAAPFSWQPASSAESKV